MLSVERVLSIGVMKESSLEVTAAGVRVVGVVQYFLVLHVHTMGLVHVYISFFSQ